MRIYKNLVKGAICAISPQVIENKAKIFFENVSGLPPQT